MSRKFHRRAQISRAAYLSIQQSLRPCPFFLPRFVWRLVVAVCVKIAFR